jgi:hypothetical protein
LRTQNVDNFHISFGQRHRGQPKKLENPSTSPFQASTAALLAEITLFMVVNEFSPRCRTALIETRRVCIQRNWPFCIEILTYPACINGHTFLIQAEKHKNPREAVGGESQTTSHQDALRRILKKRLGSR